MPLIYVTGISGSGKSAVLRELQSRGNRAYGVDEDEYGQWLHWRSGEQERFPRQLQDLDLLGAVGQWRFGDPINRLDVGIAGLGQHEGPQGGGSGLHCLFRADLASQQRLHGIRIQRVQGRGHRDGAVRWPTAASFAAAQRS